MANHSSILAWVIPWTEEPGGPWCDKKSDTIEYTHTLSSGFFLCTSLTGRAVSCRREHLQNTSLDSSRSAFKSSL